MEDSYLFTEEEVADYSEAKWKHWKGEPKIVVIKELPEDLGEPPF